jgi:hypothetical protein
MGVMKKPTAYAGIVEAININPVVMKGLLK